MQNISIVILTYNNIDSIKSCLNSISVQYRNDPETIVIDNGSTDGTSNFIKEAYPAVKLIENKENLGACKARNQGIQAARGEWVLTLDCDIILAQGFLGTITGVIETACDSVGIIQPIILNADKKTIYSCGIYLSWLKRFYDIGKGRIAGRYFNTSKFIFGACCAAALYRRKMLEGIKDDMGYFDERFFFLVEDVDVSLRAQKRKWKTLYYPRAVCYHSGNSSQTSRKTRQYLCWRNRRIFLQKHGFNRHNLLPSLLLYDFPRLAALVISNPLVRNEIFGIKDKRFNVRDDFSLQCGVK